MKDVKVSVIIPVYNVEQYLEYCIQSILSQDYNNLEIILVDDGSTDLSPEMCDEYGKKDARIKVIHKENEGQAIARNTGVRELTGDYFTFVDSDDYIRSDYISSMLKCAMEDQSDMVICGYTKTAQDLDYSKTVNEKTGKRILNREELQYEMLSRKLPMYVCGKLYKKDLLPGIHFPEGRLFEDVAVSWEVSRFVNRATFINDVMYFYRQRAGSTVNAIYKHSRMDQIVISEEIYRDVSDNEKLRTAAGMRCFFAAADTYALVTKEFPEDIKAIRDTIKKHRSEVLKSDGSVSLKVLAILSFVNPWFVRLLGKMFKRFLFMKRKLNKETK